METSTAPCGHWLRVLRWILVIPAAVAAWCSVLVAGIATLTPPESVGSLGVNVVIFSMLSAVAVVSTSVLVAPAHKKRIAWISWLVGAATATALVLSTDDLSTIIKHDPGLLFAWLAAILAGMLTASVWHVALRARELAGCANTPDSAA